MGMSHAIDVISAMQVFPEDNFFVEEEGEKELRPQQIEIYIKIAETYNDLYLYWSAKGIYGRRIFSWQMQEFLDKQVAHCNEKLDELRS
jgi:hypothetical protein